MPDPAPPAPWDLDAFPAHCQHCDKTYWYRPGDGQLHRMRQSRQEDGKILLQCSRQGHCVDDPATLWWQAIVDWARGDERQKIMDAILSKARPGPAGKQRREIAEELHHA